MKIFVTSDLHLCHQKEFLYGPRGYSSISEHNMDLIKRWNEVVADEDEVFILGDLMLNDNITGINCLERLAGRKYVVIGNHDSDARVELYKIIPGVEVLGFGYRMRYKKLNFYLSHYPSLTSNRGFEKSLEQRVINLCGHSHTKDRWQDWDKSLIYHCELDAHDMYPVPLDQIVEEVKERYYSEEEP